GEADGDVLAPAQQGARTEPSHHDERGNRDCPNPPRPPAMAHARCDAARLTGLLGRSMLVGVPVVHDGGAPRVSHISRGSKVTEATIVRNVMTMKAVAPQPAVSEPSAPKLMSGTKKTIAKGSVLDQRPVSATRRRTLVFATRCRRDPRHAENTHQPIARILTPGVRMLVQNTSAPSPHCPVLNRSVTPVK